MPVGRPVTEREVLRVLWASPEPVVRSQIHRQLPVEKRPTLGRIGQILSALHKSRLLNKSVAKAQGAKRAGFYSLSKRGREVCLELGFEHREQALFTVPHEVMRTCLTRQRLSQQPTTAARITSILGYRGGLGRTTLVAHLGKGLVEAIEGEEDILLVDLDLRAPGLSDYLQSPGLASCRGLGGLLFDSERVEARKRPLWLRSALSKPKYVVRPLPNLPRLVYLPSGLGPGQHGLSSTERFEALNLLRAEAGLEDVAKQQAGANSTNFLRELRDALLDKFSRIVIDTDSGHGMGAWIATNFLADQMVVCAQVAETDFSTLTGLRSVLATFLNREQAEASSSILFLFRLAEPTAQDDLDLWIEEHLVMKGGDPVNPASYRAEQLPDDARLARRKDRWTNTYSYRHLIARLDPKLSSPPGLTPPPPELQALMTVLDSGAEAFHRSIAAGILENAPLHELSRGVEWYVRDEALHRKTDAAGERMVQSIVERQIELLKLLSAKILQPKAVKP